VLHCVAACDSVLHRIAVCCNVFVDVDGDCLSDLGVAAVHQAWCSVVQCVAVY